MLGSSKCETDGQVTLISVVEVDGSGLLSPCLYSFAVRSTELSLRCSSASNKASGK